MYIDYSKIITENLQLFITNEQLENIKKIAEKEKCYIKGKCSKTTLFSMLPAKANEIVYTSSRHQQKNGVEKALIACNIVFDDEKIANILLNGNFDKEALVTFIKLVNYLKHKIDTDALEEKDKRYLIVADKYAKKLVSHFNKYIGGCEITIIINKINELLSFRPELLETKEAKHTR